MRTDRGPSRAPAALARASLEYMRPSPAARLRRVSASPGGGESTRAPSFAERLGAFFSWRVLLAVVFWGVSFVFTRLALDAFHPVGLVAARMWIGAAVLAVVLRLKGLPFLPERGDRAMGACLGIVLGAHLLLQAYALLYTTAISSGWIVAFNPVTIALGGQIFLGERVKALGWLGALIATAGLAVIALAHPYDLERATFGDLLILISCLTWTVFTLVSAGPTARNGALRVTAFAMAVAAGVCSLAAGMSRWLVAPLDFTAIVSVAFLGVLCSGVAFALWVSALDREGSAKIAAMLYFQPFVTLAAAALVLGEPVTAHALLGGPLVLLGVALLRKASPRREPRARPARST